MGENLNKEALAKRLYANDPNAIKSEVAQLVQVTDEQLDAWIDAGGWEVQRQGLLITRREQLATMYRLLAQETGKPAPDALKIDRITVSIERLEKNSSVGAVVNVASEFLNWLRDVERVDAILFARYMDDYLSYIAKQHYDK